MDLNGKNRGKNKGFSLVILAMIIMLAGILLVLLIPRTSDKLDSDVRATSANMQKIINALEAYRARHGAYPTPAGYNYTFTSTSFGQQGAACAAGSVYCLTTTNGETRIGTIPTRTLGISDEMTFDKWGNRYTYVMNTSTLDSITLKNIAGTTTSNVKAIVISHGPDGLGAYNRGGTIQTSCTLGSMSATASEYENCYYGSHTAADAVFIANVWNTATANYFDDLTQYLTSATLCPANVFGCNLWLDGTDTNNDGLGQADGTALSTWKDKSGNAYDATQATAVNQPRVQTNAAASKKVVRFDYDATGTVKDADATNGNTDPNWDGMTTGLNLSAAPFTVITVIGSSAGYYSRPLQGTNNWILGPYGGRATHMVSSGFVSNINFASPTPASVTGGLAVTAGQLDIYVGTNDGGYSNIYYNGASITENTTYVAVPGTLVLGARGGQQQFEPLQGDIAEVIVYPYILTDIQRKKVECYLAAKWKSCPSMGGTYSGGTQTTGPDTISSTSTAASYCSGIGVTYCGATP